MLPAPIRFVVALAAVCAIKPPPTGAQWDTAEGSADAWLDGVLATLELSREVVPADVEPEDVAMAATERETWSGEDRRGVAIALVEAALRPDGQHVSYSPIGRAAAHRTLALLGLDTALLPKAEAELGLTLTAALDAAGVDEARNRQRQGWGGALGRNIATGAGVVVGGVLLGVTGGLAAPAIAALLAPLGFGILGAAAPAVLGTLFGLTGGGLAGWRVHERWRGVDEFAFVEVGAGTRPTREEVKDMQDPPKESIDDPDDAAALAEVQAARAEVLARLSEGTEGRLAPDEPGKTTRPTLTATIVVPGLLTVSCTEAIAAWRAACGGHLQPTDTDEPYSAAILPTGLQDGRDVYVLRFETKTMLSTGRDIESWVTSRLKNLAALEVVKQTILGAYYVAVALPLSVYQLSTMTLDNSWMHAQSMAVKAGRLLGEVLEQRVQGERPVVLIGTSVGALTIFHALQYLASKPCPPIVESAFLVALPSAPTDEDWASARRIVSRRLVNGWSNSDFVLASAVRLHEVVSSASLSVRVAGLGPVMQPGVEDVDLSDTITGHFEINSSVAKVLDTLQIDE